MATNNFSNDYCVEDSDQEHATDSEDEITNFVLGTPQQRRHIKRRSLGQPSDSSEDEFEKEMESELKQKMDTDFNFQKTATVQSKSPKDRASSKRSYPDDEPTTSTQTSSKQVKSSTSDENSESAPVEVVVKTAASPRTTDQHASADNKPATIPFIMDLSILYKNGTMASEGQVPMFLKQAVLEWWRLEGKAAMSLKKNHYEHSKVWSRGRAYLQKLYPNHDIENWRKEKMKSIFHNMKRKYRQEKSTMEQTGQPSTWELFDICADTFGDESFEVKPKPKAPHKSDKPSQPNPVRAPDKHSQVKAIRRADNPSVRQEISPLYVNGNTNEAFSHPNTEFTYSNAEYSEPTDTFISPKDVYYKRKLEIMEAKYQLKLKQAAQLQVFHSDCLKLLRETANNLQRPSNSQ